MSNIELRIEMTRSGITIRLAPGMTSKSVNISTERSLIVKPDFISKKVMELKGSVPESIVNFTEFKIKKYTSENPIIENKKPVNIEDHIKNETFHPYKKMMDKLDRVNRLFRSRLRRGSRCRQSGHDPSSCYKGSGCPALRVKQVTAALNRNNEKSHSKKSGVNRATDLKVTNNKAEIKRNRSTDSTKTTA